MPTAPATSDGPRKMRRRSSGSSQLRYAPEEARPRAVVVFPTCRGPETNAIWRCVPRWAAMTAS